MKFRPDFIAVVLITLLLSSAYGFGRIADDSDIVALRKLHQGDSSIAEAGDLIEIGFAADALDGPLTLKVEIRGEGVGFQMKPITVFAPAPRPDANRPKENVQLDEIRSYFILSGEGNAVVVITQVFPDHMPKKPPIEFSVKVSRKGA